MFKSFAFFKNVGHSTQSVSEQLRIVRRSQYVWNSSARLGSSSDVCNR